MSLTTYQLLSEMRHATVIGVGRHPGPRQIVGALRYRPSDLLRAQHLLMPLDHERAVVLHGSRGCDHHIEAIAEKMRHSGFAA